MKDRHVADRPGTAELARDVARLSRLLTREREDLPAGYLRDPGLRRAYLAYYLPANVSKVHVALRELSLHPEGLPGKDRLRVLDIGTGPGTSVLGMLSFFSAFSRRPGLDFLAVDLVEQNLRDAESLFGEQRRSYAGPASLRTMVSDAAGLGPRLQGDFDIVVLSNVLNEIAAGDDARIVRRTAMLDGLMRRSLSAAGSCIIIEPALRETGRELLAVRDGLLDRGWRIFSPCLVQDRCPALARPRDWCHEERSWNAPDLVREIDDRTGLRKDALKFSYVILRRDASTLADVCGPGPFRVVSEPLVSRGKRELYLCGEGGRRLATRLDRDEAPGNSPFGGLRRGDIVRFGGMAAEQARFRITRDTQVIVVHAFR